MVNKYSLEEIKDTLRPIIQRFSPKLVYFFGSASRGQIGPLSDIDLAVLWPAEVAAPMIKSMNLQSEIKEKLGEENFEVGCLNGQNLSFCYVVISTGTCVFGSETDRVSYETEILSQYLDFNYLAEDYNRAFDKRILGES